MRPGRVFSLDVVLRGWVRACPPLARGSGCGSVGNDTTVPNGVEPRQTAPGLAPSGSHPSRNCLPCLAFCSSPLSRLRGRGRGWGVARKRQSAASVMRTSEKISFRPPLTGCMTLSSWGGESLADDLPRHLLSEPAVRRPDTGPHKAGDRRDIFDHPGKCHRTVAVGEQPGGRTGDRAESQPGAAAVGCGSCRAGVDVLLTTDDALVKRTGRHAPRLRVRALNPVTWLREEGLAP